MRMRPAAPRLLLLLLLAAALGCSRCGGGCRRPQVEATGLASRVPRTAEAVVLLPDVGALGQKVQALQQLELLDFVAPMLGAPSGAGLVDGVVRQVGLDVRRREELEKAGMAPDKGLALVLLPGGRAYSVVALKDARAFEDAVARIAQRLSGAGVKAEATEQGRRVVRFSTAPGAPPRLALAVEGGFGFLAAGPEAAKVAEHAALPLEASLAKDATFAASRARLPADADAVAWVPAGSRFLPQGTLAGVTFTGQLGLSGLTLKADAPWPDSAQTLQAFTPQAGAPELLGYLPPDAFAVARYSGDPAQLGQYWPYLVGPQVTRAVEATGFELKEEVLDNLKPGAVAALSLAPTVRMSGVPALDMRRTNPFAYAHLTVVAEGKSAEQVRDTLEHVPPVAARFGARLTPAERGGQQVLLTRYAAGEGTHLAQVDTRVLMAAPEERLVAGLERLRGKPGPVPLDKALLPALEGNALAVVVDLHTLADAVRALPSEAWGIGGFALKPTTVRWLDALHELRAVNASLTAREKALQAEVTLRLEVKPK